MSTYTPHRTRGLRIMVLGYIVRGPLGGLAWHHLQYVLGLAQLGHDVYFLEDSDDYPSCYDPVRDVTDSDPAYGLRFTAGVLGKFGLGERWAYLDAHTSTWMGPCAGRILRLCSSADLLLNVSGVNPLRPWLTGIPARALIDTDPVFTQIRHLTDAAARRSALQHTAFLSFGENIGQSSCTIPDDGLPWQATRQPVVLEAWPLTPAPAGGRLTTVMQWNSYPAAEYGGRRYGMKSDSFGPYMELPKSAGSVLELALGGASAPRALLKSQGWALRDSREPTLDPWVYQRYIQRSKAEFSIAKQGYVMSCSGWFSERSAGYLASGRPVLVQQTGFSRWLPAGPGVIPFNTPQEALAGIQEMNRNYDLHCRGARQIAEEYFDSRKVLTSLVEHALRPATALNHTPSESL